jgi:membrane-associated phospholipid phosphatase
MTAERENHIRDATHSGPIHEFLPLVSHIVQDQKEIWTSPLRSERRDLPNWLAFAGGTALLIAFDQRIDSALPRSREQIAISKVASRVGTLYSLLPAAAICSLVGRTMDNPRLRNAGGLGVRALIDTEIVAQALKLATQRPRPDKEQARGQFWHGGNSFPSAHSIKCWALASVLSAEFAHTKLMPTVAYGCAAAVSVARLIGRRHFASDALAGAAMGWFIGRYVYRKYKHAAAGMPR